MHVLIVHRPRPDDPGTTRSVAHDVAALRARGHRVTVTAVRGLPAPEADEVLELPWPEIPSWSGLPARALARLAAPLAGVRARLRRHVARTRPDLVHVHCAGGPVPELHALATVTGAPRVTSLHDFTPVCPAGSLFSGGAVCERCLHGDLSPAVIRRCVDKDLLRSTAATLAARGLNRRDVWRGGQDLVLVPSRCVRDLLAKGGLDLPRLAVLPPALPDPGPAPALPDDPTAPVLYAGPLDGASGLTVLLQAYAMLGPDRPPLRLVGDGPLKGELAALGEQLDLDVLTFHEPVTGAALSAELAACRFVVLPAVGHVPEPLTVLDALAHGRPVLATRRGALPDLVDHEVGRLVEPRDASALARALDGLARDPVLAGHLAGKARERFEERHTLPAHGAALEAVYQALLEGRVDELVERRGALLHG